MLGDRRHLELAYSLVFALPGSPVLRYSDEVGMGDDLNPEQREAVRTPMQWSGEHQAGFSLARKLIHPVISEGVYSHAEINVEEQRRDPASLLNWTARMIRLRKECPEIGWGTVTVLETGSDTVLAMRYDWRDNSLVTVHNFDEKPHDISLNLQVAGGEALINQLKEERSVTDKKGAHQLVLEAYGYRWYRVGGLNYALKHRRT